MNKDYSFNGSQYGPVHLTKLTNTHFYDTPPWIWVQFPINVRHYKIKWAKFKKRNNNLMHQIHPSTRTIINYSLLSNKLSKIQENAITILCNKSILAQGTIPLEKGGSRPHIGETLKMVSINFRTRNWRIWDWHFCVLLIKVSNAMFSCNFGPKTWLYSPSFQFLPVDQLEPFMPLYFITSLWSTTKPLTRVLLKQLRHKKNLHQLLSVREEMEDDDGEIHRHDPKIKQYLGHVRTRYKQGSNFFLFFSSVELPKSH